MEWAVMEFAETLVLVGVVRRYVVGKSEEEESEGLPWDEVEAGPLNATGVRHGFGWMANGSRDLFHLFEAVYDRGMEFVFVMEVVLEVATSCKCFWAEGAPVASRELTKEAVEVEVTECRGGVLTALTTKEGKVARVHPGALNHGERRELIQSLTRRRIGCVLVDEVRFEAIPIFE
jgi:hypothetical protein